MSIIKGIPVEVIILIILIIIIINNQKILMIRIKISRKEK
jgi:hypothetical protein